MTRLFDRDSKPVKFSLPTVSRVGFLLSIALALIFYGNPTRSAQNNSSELVGTIYSGVFVPSENSLNKVRPKSLSLNLSTEEKMVTDLPVGLHMRVLPDKSAYVFSSNSTIDSVALKHPNARTTIYRQNSRFTLGTPCYRTTSHTLLVRIQDSQPGEVVESHTIREIDLKGNLVRDYKVSSIDTLNDVADDSLHLLFTQQDKLDGTLMSLVVYNIATGEEKVILRGYFIGDSRFSRDSQTVASVVTSDSKSCNNIVLVDVNNKRSQQIFPGTNQTNPVSISWSPTHPVLSVSCRQKDEQIAIKVDNIISINQACSFVFITPDGLILKKYSLDGMATNGFIDWR